MFIIDYIKRYIKIKKNYTNLSSISIETRGKDINNTIDIIAKYSKKIKIISITSYDDTPKILFHLEESKYDDNTYYFTHFPTNFKMFNNNIALLQNLGNISIWANYRVINLFDYKITENIKYIYEDKMLYLVFKNIETIPSNIKFLNIININNDNVHLLNNLPETIKTLHISTIEPLCLYKINNLSYKLEKFDIIIFNDISHRKVNNYKDKFNSSLIKIPFNCKFSCEWFNKEN
jgi:hypothetical protein